MAEVVTVTTTKPRVAEITLKISATEATDQLLFIKEYYNRAGWMGPAENNPTYKVIKQALDGVKPKLDGINIANGKVTVF